MTSTFVNLNSRVAIAGRIAEYHRLSQYRDELTIPGDYHLPFGKSEARAEAARWFWQAA